MFPDSFINQVRQSVDLVELVSAHVKLKKKGRRWWGLSPFKPERTPSFTISPDAGTNGLFYCFASNTGGDAISFVMHPAIMGLDFQEAVRFLAKRSGMQIPEEDSAMVTASDVLARMAKRWHEDLLANTEALDYLIKERQIAMDAIKHFQVGVSTTSPLELGISPEMAVAADVMRANENGTLRLTFNNRITFPIRNRLGSVVGFTARVWHPNDTHPAKYINSSDVVFNKSAHLYGIYENRKGIREADKVWMVEGPLCVLGMYSAGHDYLVASMGLSVSETAIHNLRRITDNIVIVRDGDMAGHKRLPKDLMEFAKNGVYPGAIAIPITSNGPKDIDDLRKHKWFLEDPFNHVDKYENFVDYLHSLYKRVPSDAPNSPRIKKRIVEKLYEYLSAIPSNNEQSAWVDHASAVFKIPREDMDVEWRGFSISEERGHQVMRTPEADALLLLIHHPDKHIELMGDTVMSLAKIMYGYWRKLASFIKKLGGQPPLPFDTMEHTSIFRHLVNPSENSEAVLQGDALKEAYSKLASMDVSFNDIAPIMAYENLNFAYMGKCLKELAKIDDDSGLKEKLMNNILENKKESEKVLKQ